ncbi:adenylosuccinate synthase [Pseudomonas resinovorans]|uniref:Adenylosuccinate synthase n=1 Tax=Metapseudomonas resinovorans TaxID=53412 RepID=A0ABT4Y8S5_METRE|nr:adenylosuccinate synthase [Pseudomonas resinovorans]MDA8485121.1 adenylosuccinate synthase [Pseudomonas resinovorans]
MPEGTLFEYSHADLCTLAVKWLKRPNSAGGPGCHVAVSECRSGWTGEIPDAIGFRAAGSDDDGSIVVECKTSRSDFLADKKKAHRAGGGLGNFRYFMAPEGLISPSELPEGWGLLTVNNRGHVKVVAGLAVHYRESWGATRAHMATWRHDADRHREQFLLVKLLHRVGDPEALNQNLRNAYAEQRRLINRVNELNDQIRHQRLQHYTERAQAT